MAAPRKIVSAHKVGQLILWLRIEKQISFGVACGDEKIFLDVF